MAHAAQIKEMPVVSYARAHTAEMVQVLVDIALDPAAKEAARVAAAQAVLNRGWGTPTQQLVVHGETPKEFDMTALTSDQLREFHNLLSKIVPSAEVVSEEESVPGESRMKNITPLAVVDK